MLMIRIKFYAELGPIKSHINYFCTANICNFMNYYPDSPPYSSDFFRSYNTKKMDYCLLQNDC